jgi:hypothetical protein
VWKIVSVSAPTNFKPGDKSGADAIMVAATNVGGSTTGCTEEQLKAEATAGPEETPGPIPAFSPFRQCSEDSPIVSPVTISDALPRNLAAVEAFGDNAYHDPDGEDYGHVGHREQEVGGLACTHSPTAVSCTTTEPVAVGDTLIVTIRVHVETDVAGVEENEVSVSGGGAAEASTSESVAISTAPAAYGLAEGGTMAASSSHEAGGHPNVTGLFFLNTINPAGEREGETCGNEAAECTTTSEPVALPKDVRFDLPAGLVGSTVGMARCTMAEVSAEANCPRDAMVGAATLVASRAGQRLVVTVPVYNIPPSDGEPAAFAFNAFFFPVRLDTSVVESPSHEYSVRVTAPGITGGASGYMASVTFWGVPAEHNGPGPDAASKNLSGLEFLDGGRPKPQITFGGPGIEEFTEEHVEKVIYDQRVPLLTAPTQCSTPLTTTVETDSWEAPGVYATKSVPVGAATECANLPFASSFSMLPDTLQAGAPAGYALDLAIPQSSEPEQLGTANVRRVVATLPEGTVISPSAATGLGVCTSEQFYGPAPAAGTPSEPSKPNSCPSSSKIGTVHVKSPDLEEELPGEVYLGAPECEPCSPRDAAEGRLVRLFVQIQGEEEDGEHSVLVKVEGVGAIDQETDQLTTTFNEDPQFPFSKFDLKLTGGERAALANPRTCGPASTTLDLTPWSTPFTPDATASYAFAVEGCFGRQFTPYFSAGTSNNQAGGFSPVVVTFGRADADEYLSAIQVHTPPGLLGMISRIKLCSEAQANAGTCSPESQIGEVSVDAGPGPHPYVVAGGKAYITGPYKGASYGLSVVVPAKAGPYTLSGTTGDGTVVVRATITVNPATSALTVTSEPFPTQLDGIPLQVRQVNVTVGTNSAFTFNPTNCSKMAISATLTSVAGATASDSSSFQLANCAHLKFMPKVSVSTSGKASKRDGAALLFKISYPAGAMGSESWFHEAKFVIPKQLPARLTTIQKACTAAVFEANPAACPPQSRIGYAQVHTPVLPQPLKGPVFFVSYGNAKFPDVVVLLQGEGVTVKLTGETLIKKGVTSATFPTAPDVPFESLEVILPTGEFSEFGAYVSAKHPYDLCGTKLVVPTELKAQNGLEVKQSTPIQVTGCAKPKRSAKGAAAHGPASSSRHTEASKS